MGIQPSLLEDEEPTEWALVRGEYTGIYKVWSKQMWDIAKDFPNTNGTNTLVTFGDKEVLTLLAQLHNEQRVREEGIE